MPGRGGKNSPKPVVRIVMIAEIHSSTIPDQGRGRQEARFSSPAPHPRSENPIRDQLLSRSSHFRKLGHPAQLTRSAARLFPQRPRQTRNFPGNRITIRGPTSVQPVKLALFFRGQHQQAWNATRSFVGDRIEPSGRNAECWSQISRINSRRGNP